MPYKNKEMQKLFVKNWKEEHAEDMKWSFRLWVESHREQKQMLDAKSRKKHQEYYNWLARFKRMLKNLSEDIYFIEIDKNKW